MAGAAFGFSTGVARVRIRFGRVPKNDLTAAVGILEDRLRQTWDAVSDLGERVTDDREASEARAKELAAMIAAEAARLAALDRQIAAGGIRLEAVGLVVVAVGIVMQGLGS